MQVTITLTDKEVAFLQKLISTHKKFEPGEDSIEDAIHDCIETAMFDEHEHET